MKSLSVPLANTGGPDHRQTTSFPVRPTVDPPLFVSAWTFDSGKISLPVKISVLVPLRSIPVNPGRVSAVRVVFSSLVLRVHLVLEDRTEELSFPKDTITRK